MAESASSVDHERLWRNTLDTLKSLKAYWISPLRVTTVPNTRIGGGFGDVHQGKLRSSPFSSGAIIAIKKLRPAGDREQCIRVMAALARELLVWSKLEHPHILPLEGFYFDEYGLNTAWIVTPWFPRGNLRKYLQVTRPDGTARIKLALGAARGLAYLHQLSPPVCYGDIKAENALVSDSGDVVLCDFGLSKVLEDNPSGLTTTRNAPLTLRYASPELVGEGGYHTLESDMWALGCLVLVVRFMTKLVSLLFDIHQIMSEILPYNSYKNEYGIIKAIALDKESPADIVRLSLPHVIRQVLHGCWERDSISRITASVLLAQLDASKLFRVPLDEIPEEYEVGHEGWRGVRNPLSQRILNFQPPRDLMNAEVDAREQYWLPFTVPGPACSIASGSLLVTRSTKAELFDIQTGRVQSSWENASWISQAALSSDRKRLATISYPGNLLVVDLIKGSLEASLLLPIASLNCIGLTFADHDRLLVATERSPDRSWIAAYDLEKACWLPTSESRKALAGVAASAAHPLIIILRTNHLLGYSHYSPKYHNALILDLRTDRVFQELDDVVATAFTSDGNNLFTTSSSGRVRIWDFRPFLDYPQCVAPASQQSQLSFKEMEGSGCQERVESIFISSDDSLAATVGEDMVLWDCVDAVPIMKISIKPLYSPADVLGFGPDSTAFSGAILFTYWHDEREDLLVQSIDYEAAAASWSHSTPGPAAAMVL